MTSAITLLTALIPANPVSMVATPDLAQARDRWLRLVLVASIVWSATHGLYWVSLLACWCLLRWRDPSLHPTLLLWAAVVASWAGFRSLSWDAFDVITWVWLALAGLHVVLCVVHWRTADWSQIKRLSLARRGKGALGSPVTTAFLFALVAPFCPWWGWPLLAVGFWVTCSWSALVATSAGLAWLYADVPWMIMGVLGGLGIVGGLLWWSPVVRGQRLLEWTPRGDSTDAFASRLTMTRLLIAGWWIGGHRWLGLGPGSAAKAGRQWCSRSRVELPIGEAHNDPLQVLYEYGLVGAAAMVAFAVPILMNLRLGDEWSAAWLIGVLVSSSHWPWRHPVLGLMLLAISARLA